jgi:hypothetical protein
MDLEGDDDNRFRRPHKGQQRRADDVTLREVVEVLREISGELQTIQTDMKEVKEVVLAWRSVKAFGVGVKWLAGVLAAVGVLWVIFTKGFQGGS